MDTESTYGICVDGKGLAINEQAIKFSKIENVYCFSLFDCCRNRISITKGIKGSLFILYAVPPNEEARGFEGEGSLMTNAFLKEFEDKSILVKNTIKNSLKIK